MAAIIKREKFSNQACKYIREKILSGEFKSGERLIETKVAKELGISQSPVREALRELEVMGLVEIKPYCGCFVLPADEKKLQQAYALRTLVECFAAREGIAQIGDSALQIMEDTIAKMKEAAENGDVAGLSLNDVRFHSVIVESAQNTMLGKIWRLVGAPQWTRFTIGTYKDIHFFPESHRSILELAKARDPEGVAHELEHHFQVAMTVVAENFKKQDAVQ